MTKPKDLIRRGHPGTEINEASMKMLDRMIALADMLNEPIRAIREQVDAMKKDEQHFEPKYIVMSSSFYEHYLKFIILFDASHTKDQLDGLPIVVSSDTKAWMQVVTSAFYEFSRISDDREPTPGPTSSD